MKKLPYSVGTILFLLSTSAFSAGGPNYKTYELKAEYNVRVLDSSNSKVLVSKAMLPKGTWVEFAADAPQEKWNYETSNGSVESTLFIEGVKVSKLPKNYQDFNLEELNDEKLFIGQGLIKAHTFVADQSDFELDNGFKIYRSSQGRAWALKNNNKAKELIDCVRRELDEEEFPTAQLEALAATYSLNLAPVSENFPDDLEFSVDFEAEGIRGSSAQVEALRRRRCAIQPMLKSIYKPEVITLINFGLQASQKRQFVIDVNACLRGSPSVQKMIVTHGRNTSRSIWAEDYAEMEEARYFSNVDWSKKSSVGYYLTGATYDPVNVGKYVKGLSLYGLESTNDLACERDIIAHGARYAEQVYVNENGYVGRSWGCPAVPRNYIKEGLFNKQRGGSLYVIIRGPNGILE